MAPLAEDRLERIRAIGDPIVRQDPLDLDPIGGEDGQSLGQADSSARASLIRHVNDDALTAAVVNDYFEVVVPKARAV